MTSNLCSLHDNIYAEFFLPQIVSALFMHNFSLVENCLTASCQNGATCTNDTNNYICSCVVGYTGYWCQTGTQLTQYYNIL